MSQCLIMTPLYVIQNDEKTISACWAVAQFENIQSE